MKTKPILTFILSIPILLLLTACNHSSTNQESPVQPPPVEVTLERLSVKQTKRPAIESLFEGGAFHNNALPINKGDQICYSVTGVFSDESEVNLTNESEWSIDEGGYVRTDGSCFTDLGETGITVVHASARDLTSDALEIETIKETELALNNPINFTLGEEVSLTQGTYGLLGFNVEWSNGDILSNLVVDEVISTSTDPEVIQIQSENQRQEKLRALGPSGSRTLVNFSYGSVEKEQAIVISSPDIIAMSIRLHKLYTNQEVNYINKGQFRGVNTTGLFQGDITEEGTGDGTFTLDLTDDTQFDSDCDDIVFYENYLRATGGPLSGDHSCIIGAVYNESSASIPITVRNATLKKVEVVSSPESDSVIMYQPVHFHAVGTFTFDNGGMVKEEITKDVEWNTTSGSFEPISGSPGAFRVQGSVGDEETVTATASSTSFSFPSSSTTSKRGLKTVQIKEGKLDSIEIQLDESGPNGTLPSIVPLNQYREFIAIGHYDGGSGDDIALDITNSVTWKNTNLAAFSNSTRKYTAISSGGEMADISASYEGVVSNITTLTTDSASLDQVSFDEIAYYRPQICTNGNGDNRCVADDAVTWTQWSTYTWDEADTLCSDQGRRLPSSAELNRLTLPYGNISLAYGWPYYSHYYWTMDKSDSGHYAQYVDGWPYDENDGNHYMVLCVDRTL